MQSFDTSIIRGDPLIRRAVGCVWGLVFPTAYMYFTPLGTKDILDSGTGVDVAVGNHHAVEQEVH